jgi:hypothetical protein
VPTREWKGALDISWRDRGLADYAPLCVTLLILVSALIWPAYEWPPNIPGPALGFLSASIAYLTLRHFVAPIAKTTSNRARDQSDSGSKEGAAAAGPAQDTKPEPESMQVEHLWLISLAAAIGTTVLVATERGVAGLSPFVAPPQGVGGTPFQLPPLLVLLAIVVGTITVAVLARSWPARAAAVGTGIVMLTLTVENSVVPKLSPNFPINIKWSSQFSTHAPSPTSAAPPQSPVSVYVGYVDTLRPGGTGLPSPWGGTQDVTLVGGDPFDGGALLFDNTTARDITLERVAVYLGSVRFAIWSPNLTVKAHSKLILTQTQQFNFDTSDQPITCTPTGAIPIVSWVIDGRQYSYLDKGRILNDGGIDQGSCNNWNESHQWELLTTAETSGPP